ncbi:undecaprenyl-phosphate glucose phosphotransferase [Methanobacterium paludis]|nr:undecaprenyl-phosphate glucose phosphotransferase [Methanobacterium paludis]
MIRENQRFLNMIFVCIDMAILAFSLIFAWYIRFETSLLPFKNNWGLNYYLMFLLFILPIYIFLYYSSGLYRPHRTKSIASESITIVKINVIGLLLLITLLYVTHLVNFSRYLLAMFAISSTTFTIVERIILRKSLRFIRSKGFNIKHILVIGAGDLGKKFACKIKQNEYIGYNIIGYLDDNIENGHKVLDSKVIGNINDLVHVILTNRIDKAVITISPIHYKVIEDIVDTLEKYGVEAEIVPDYYRYFPANPYIDLIDDMPIIKLRYVPLDKSFNHFIKRILDIVLAIAIIIITSPILVLTALMVKISSPGPVIFKQERVGLHRKEFNIYKFRSMKVQDEKYEKYQWTSEDDHRKTKFGSFIRKSNIDELPQLFNILKGDMSLIGPRPERPHFVDKFRDEIPKYMIKHYVRPGMTGLAQVNGFRGNTSIKKRIEYDIYYVENWNLKMDIKIFFMTFIHAFRNAY